MSAALELETDVLVIGGGLAGCWAALGAVRAGASVIVAEKGYCGTSGVTATAGPGHWWVAPEARAQAIAERNARAFGLAEPDWMARILDLTWRSLPTLADYYRFPTDARGEIQYRGLRGPEYMRAMRRLIADSGVRILDHSPALELLTLRDGAVAGAAGLRTRTGEDWLIRSGAVVIASGGCAFASDLLGSANNTGDGLLMGVEAGADLSGMEFTNYYTVAAKGTTMTRSMSYSFARYFDAAGAELDIPPAEAVPALAAALLCGPVFCRLDRTPYDIRQIMRQVQPNFMLPFDRLGIDPYADLFEVTLHPEGTVRGVGGLRVTAGDCRTRAPGLFAAGDAATRELVAGATSGGGAQNSSWALSSGQWAGAGAAAHAHRHGRRALEVSYAAGRAGLRPRLAQRGFDRQAAVALVREEMGAFEKNMFRHGAALRASAEALGGAFRELADVAGPAAGDRLRLRETAALLAAARWSKLAAVTRQESRGMHRRRDATEALPRFARRQTIGGLEQVWSRFESPRTEAA
jgi:succinate dehydrogenase/fumarate reductase flavoprotein subunit